ncbi:DUF397 domain-containing protein [Streptomyces sp. NPDC006446]|uniref:DUF397 domain-containing protein n=1 Tax=Streptomyces sp. NPDC006446 TaxID=3154301 RepID=UPI0033A1F753
MSSGVAARPDSDGPAWIKSSYSAGNGGECVEVATWQGTTHVRDSKHTAGPVVGLGQNAWTQFLGFAARHAT